MNSNEIKKLLISSLKPDTGSGDIFRQLENEGISYDFSENFDERVLGRIFSAPSAESRKVEFLKSMNFAFYRIALTGVAAIVVLLISIFLMEGSLSFNSFLGLSDSFDESIVCLLTGN